MLFDALLLEFEVAADQLRLFMVKDAVIARGPQRMLQFVDGDLLSLRKKKKRTRETHWVM